MEPIIPFITLSLAFGAMGGNHGSNETVEPKCCGRNAISVVASFLGVEEVPGDWKHVLRTEEAPFSLLQLEAAAHTAGLETLLVNWPSPINASLECPCVLHVKRSEASGEADHFIACFGERNGQVCLADYPGRPVMVPRERLLRVWSGTALYLDCPGGGKIEGVAWQLRLSSASSWAVGLLVFLAVMGTCFLSKRRRKQPALDESEGRMRVKACGGPDSYS